MIDIKIQLWAEKIKSELYRLGLHIDFADALGLARRLHALEVHAGKDVNEIEPGTVAQKLRERYDEGEIE